MQDARSRSLEAVGLELARSDPVLGPMEPCGCDVAGAAAGRSASTRPVGSSNRLIASARRDRFAIVAGAHRFDARVRCRSDGWLPIGRHRRRGVRRACGRGRRRGPSRLRPPRVGRRFSSGGRPSRRRRPGTRPRRGDGRCWQVGGTTCSWHPGHRTGRLPHLIRGGPDPRFLFLLTASSEWVKLIVTDGGWGRQMPSTAASKIAQGWLAAPSQRPVWGLRRGAA